jgi:hypothetical protein
MAHVRGVEYSRDMATTTTETSTPIKTAGRLTRGAAVIVRTNMRPSGIAYTVRDVMPRMIVLEGARGGLIGVCVDPEDDSITHMLTMANGGRGAWRHLVGTIEVRS